MVGSIDLNKGLSKIVDNTTSNTTGKDVTDEVFSEEEEVDIYKIRELAPQSAPMTVPYLEIMRTNELEYVPYMSPYNVGVGSSNSTSQNNTNNNNSNTEYDDSDILSNAGNTGSINGATSNNQTGSSSSNNNSNTS